MLTICRSPYRVAQHALLEATQDETTLATLRRLFPTRDGISEEYGFSHLHEIVLGLSSDDLGTALASDYLSIDVPDLFGRTPLIWAALRGDSTNIKLLLKAGASTNVQDSYGQTSLHCAVRSSSTPCVKMLLNAGADVLMNTEARSTALSLAAWYVKSREMIEILVAAGSDPNHVQAPENLTPLTTTISRKHTKTMEALIDFGGKIDFRVSDGDTLLHIAIFCKSHDAMMLLLSRGADFMLLNHDGYHILHYAAKYGDSQTVHYLRKANLHGIDTSSIAKDGRNAIQIAQQRQNKPDDFVSLFKKLLVEIDERNAANAAQRIASSSIPGESRTVEDTQCLASSNQRPVRLSSLRNYMPSPTWVATSSRRIRECLKESLLMAVLLSWILGFACAGLLYFVLKND